MRRVLAFLPHRHELVVCTVYCDTLPVGEPTAMESQAMSIDSTNPIDAMAYAEKWRADARRVQRTAEFFLGANVYAALVPKLREEWEQERTKREAWRERYVPTLDDDDPEQERHYGDDDDDFDLPF